MLASLYVPMSIMVSLRAPGVPDTQYTDWVMSWISAWAPVGDSDSEVTTTSPAFAPASTNPPAGVEKLNPYTGPPALHCAVTNAYASRLSVNTPLKSAAPCESWAGVHVILGMVNVALAL